MNTVMTCRLSVITPVYNGIRFIEFCIRNVIGQECPGVEHIIIDGGSTDGTVDVIRRYAEEYAHIRWVSEPDRGQSDAMNKGIGMASGGIVGFLNVDDYYEPGALSEAVGMFENLPEPTLLVGNCNVRDADDRLQFVNRPSRVGLLALLMLYVPAFPANPSAYFYHRTLHEKIGLYDRDEHFAMDMHFIFRTLAAAQVRYVDRVWGNYRYHADTKTFRDVEIGGNRTRVAEIAAFYRKQAPFHYRAISTLFIRLVTMYKTFRKRSGFEG